MDIVGVAVGANVGRRVVGLAEGERLGLIVGKDVGSGVGSLVGLDVGDSDGDVVGADVWHLVQHVHGTSRQSTSKRWRGPLGDRCKQIDNGIVPVNELE